MCIPSNYNCYYYTFNVQGRQLRGICDVQFHASLFETKKGLFALLLIGGMCKR